MELEHDKFTDDELSRCLDHYDIGRVRNRQEFARGSRRSPKVVLHTDKGKFLFKRRVHGRDDLSKVAFTHDIQLELARRGFPLPALTPTREGKTILLLDGNVYEMFQYVKGEGYDASAEATLHAGRTLALYHRLLRDFTTAYNLPQGSYHNARSIHQAIRNTVGALPLSSRPPAEVVVATVDSLRDTYLACCRKADSLGLGGWHKQIVHGDWHPGNMLFRNRTVVAVVDYDAARLQQSAIDLANGALQFSIIGGPDGPEKWPDKVDETRFRSFLAGYDSINPVPPAEAQAVPYLMCEAMIAEAVLPIAATGSFGRIDGFPFLQMIQRKVEWILSHLDRLQAVLKA
jgi:homoserine kinase type II